MAACRSCEAEVRWVVVVASGKRMPLDPQPVADGNVVLLSGNETVRVLSKAEAERRAAQPGGPGPLYKSHFATCPNGPAHRRA
jgi:hypothetical protein